MSNHHFVASLTLRQRVIFNRFVASHAQAHERNIHAGSDPRHLALPHHRRVTLNNLLASEIEFLEALAPKVIEAVKMGGWNRLDIAQLFLSSYPLLTENVYLNRMDVLTDLALRLMVHYGRIRTFQTTDALEEMLQATDFGSDVPAEWFRPPYDEVYFEFGEQRRFPVSINDPNSGDHVIEGAYILSGLSPSHKDGRLVRGFDVVIYGSPMGKTSVLDDCYVHMGFPIDDESISVSEAMRSAVEYYSRQGAFRNQEAFQPVIEHLAKILVYLCTKDARQEQLLEGTEARRRMEGMKSSSKREKALRQSARFYDRIVIGPAQLPSDMAINGSHASVRPHVRRGHFRAQPFGPQNSLRRPVWIRPTMVGRERIAAGEMESPAYVIR